MKSIKVLSAVITIILSCSFVLPIVSSAGEQSPIKITVVSFDYDLWPLLPWIDPSQQSSESDTGRTELGRYSVPTDLLYSFKKSLDKPRQYWMRLQVAPLTKSMTIQSLEFYANNCDDLHIWTKADTSAFELESTYCQPLNRPVQDAIGLLVDPMRQTDEEILDRIKRLDWRCKVTYLDAAQQLVEDDVAVDFQKAVHLVKNESNGANIWISSIKLRKISDPSYYPVPIAVKKAMRKSPNDFRLAVLTGIIQKNMDFNMYHMSMFANNSDSVWTKFSPQIDSIGGVTEMEVLHFLKNADCPIEIYCVMRMKDASNSDLIKALRESGLSMQFYTEVFGDVLGQDGGAMQYGPLFSIPVQFDSGVTIRDAE